MSRLENIRKLPPYAELKRLYCEENLSQEEIANRYGCTKTAVATAMKRRALAHGDPWPLLTKEQRAERHLRGTIKNGATRRKLPPYPVLKRLYVGDGMSHMDIAEIYRVNPSTVSQAISKGARAAGEHPLLTPAQVEQRRRRGLRYRNHVSAGVIMDMVKERMAELDIPSNHALAKVTGLSAGVFDRFDRGEHERIRKTTAVRLLEWLDEEVPSHLIRGPRPIDECACGEPLSLGARGPRVKYCSSTCYEKFTGKKYKPAGRTYKIAA